jgi:hypothetical protein
MATNHIPVDEGPPGDRLPQLDAALEKGEATIHQLLETHFGQRDWQTPDSAQRDTYAWYYPRIRAAFEKKSGSIDEFYACTDIRAAVLLTSNDDLLLYYDVGQCPQADALLASSYRLATEVPQYLNGSDLRRCLEMIFDTLNGTLGMMNRAADSKLGQDQIITVNEETLTVYEGDLAHAQRFFDRATQRRSQITYFWGMTAGLAIPAVVIGCLTIVWIQTDSDFDFGPLVGALGAGAIGAWISVIQRMASSSLQLDYSAGSSQLRLLGMFRPVVGAIFGAALYFVIESEVLPVAIRSDGRNDLFFFIAVGFIAGFQERWAQDMLTLSKNNLNRTPETPSSSDKADS